MKQIHKYITLTEYTDLETGEVISKSTYERQYYKVRTVKCDIEIKEVRVKNEIQNHLFKKYRYECRPKNQLRLF